MADEIEEEVFDAGKLAQALEAEGPAPEPAEEGAEAAAAEEEAEASPEAPAPMAEEEDDDKLASAGKPISPEGFKARLARWKKKDTERETALQTIRAELEAAKKSQPATAEDLQKFKALDSVFANLDKSARELPFIQEMLLALGAGKKPDWNKVKEGMESYLESVPKGDPILYQQLEQQRAQIEEIQTERINNQALTHVQTENVEIAKILGSDMDDPYTKSMWDILNEQAKLAFAAMNPKDFKEGPNRVQMAKRLAAASEAYHQKQMKKQLPTPLKPKLNIAAGNGQGGGKPLKEEETAEFDPAKLAEKIMAAQKT